MTYEQARKFIEQTTKFGSILGLTSMKALMEALGNVQNTIPIIHIAGTNGKGSVGAYLASIFKEAGLKVGRYCSPAVFHPLECWQYDGRTMTKDEYAKIMSQVKEACDIVVSKGIQPTVFEVETAVAFVWFSQMPTDVLLLETGLGGATDATNVVANPLACVFTTISRDHMQFLGETLSEIATVKAGIIKKGAKVFSAIQKPEVEEVLREYYTLRQKSVADVQQEDKKWKNIIFVQEENLHLISQKVGELTFSYKNKTYTTQLSGVYQIKNATLAIEVAEELLKVFLKYRTDNSQFQMCKELIGKCSLDRKTNECKQGFILEQDKFTLKQEFFLQNKNTQKSIIETILYNGIKNTIWNGRFEIIQREPLFIIDGAHNEDAACMLSQTLENCFTNDSLIYIIGVLADKEHKQMLEIMSKHSKKVYTITPPNARGLNASLLAEEAKLFYEEVTVCETITQTVTEAVAYAKAQKKAILAFGSLSYLSELKKIVKKEKIW